MAHATCELVWLRHFPQELQFCEVGQMELVCDNQSTLRVLFQSSFYGEQSIWNSIAILLVKILSPELSESPL